MPAQPARRAFGMGLAPVSGVSFWRAAILSISQSGMHNRALCGILKMVGKTEKERWGLEVEDSRKQSPRSRRQV